MKVLARTGGNVAFLSRFDVAEEQRSGQLVYLPLQEAAALANPLRLVHRARETLDPAAAILADHLIQELHLVTMLASGSAG